MIMAPGPSRLAAWAMMSRSPVGAGRNIGPEVDLRAAAASDKATRLDEMKHSTSAACCHITDHKIVNLLCECTVWHVRAVRRPGVPKEKVARRLCLNLLEVAVDVGDDPAAHDARQLDSARGRHHTGLAPAA